MKLYAHRHRVSRWEREDAILRGTNCQGAFARMLHPLPACSIHQRELFQYQEWTAKQKLVLDNFLTL